MSDLKYQNPAQLAQSQLECEEYISRLQTDLAGQQERLKWIKRYIYEKTPQEMTIEEIEVKLGHKLIIK